MALEDWDETEDQDNPDLRLCQKCLEYFYQWHFFNNQFCSCCVSALDLVYDIKEDRWEKDFMNIDLG